jgi:D-alanine-D-alanine ligase
VGIVGSEALPVVEIVAPNGNYDYVSKYTMGLTQYLAPAPLDEKTRKECQACALRAFEVLGCRGLARVDFRLSESGGLHVLELNNIPGFTETSLLPKAAACAGVPFASLCERVMESAAL